MILFYKVHLKKVGECDIIYNVKKFNKLHHKSINYEVFILIHTFKQLNRNGATIYEVKKTQQIQHESTKRKQISFAGDMYLPQKTGKFSWYIK